MNLGVRGRGSTEATGRSTLLRVLGGREGIGSEDSQTFYKGELLEQKKLRHRVFNLRRKRVRFGREEDRREEKYPNK